MSKIGFVTCVKLGLDCIQEIYKLNYKIDVIITLNDELAVKKSGRVFLDDFCNLKKIPLLKINHINELKTINCIKSYDLDWLFIIGWSQIANDDVLKIPKYGVLGMHPTLLPYGRGRASIPNAILNSLDFTGVTFFKLNKEVDSGPIINQIKIPLNKKINAYELYIKTQKAHVELIRKSIKNIIDNNVQFFDQDESKATYWSGRKPADGEILENMSLSYAEKLVRATTKPYPGAFCFIEDEKYIIWEAQISRELPSKDQKYLKFNEGFLIFTKFEKEKI